MARRWSFYMDLLPILVLIGVECCDMGLLTLFKAATLRGMSNHVFVSYAYAVGAIVLLPAPFFSKRSSVVTPLNFSIISKIVLLGAIGSSAQILGYIGITYSSPTLSSSIGNLVPAFTFLLAVLFRMERIAVKSRSSQAKILGSIISVAGAFVLTLYKGPSITMAHTQLSLPIQKPISILNAVDTSWAIAGILLTAEYLLSSVWYILQVEILKEYPDKLNMLLLYCVTATIISITVALFTEPNASAWKIRLDISLISILCTGLLGKFFSNAVKVWVLHLKGAVYVTSFKPLTIVFTVAMGVMFLDDTLHTGSVIGATIISIGLYTVLWGKAKEEAGEDIGSQQSLTTENVPLLYSYKTEDSEKKIDANV